MPWVPLPEFVSANFSTRLVSHALAHAHLDTQTSRNKGFKCCSRSVSHDPVRHGTSKAGVCRAVPSTLRGLRENTGKRASKAQKPTAVRVGGEVFVGFLRVFLIKTTLPAISRRGPRTPSHLEVLGNNRGGDRGCATRKM